MRTKAMPGPSGGRRARPTSTTGSLPCGAANTRTSTPTWSRGTSRPRSATWPRSPASWAAACTSIPRPSSSSTIPRPTSSSSATTANPTWCRTRSDGASAGGAPGAWQRSRWAQVTTGECQPSNSHSPLPRAGEGQGVRVRGGERSTMYRPPPDLFRPCR